MLGDGEGQGTFDSTGIDIMTFFPREKDTHVEHRNSRVNSPLPSPPSIGARLLGIETVTINSGDSVS